MEDRAWIEEVNAGLKGRETEKSLESIYEVYNCELIGSH